MAISFTNADVKFSLSHRKELAKFISSQIELYSLVEKHKISFIFCSDEFLLKINQQFLKHNYYTDIITFPLTHSSKLLEAEVYISIDRVKENAEKYTSPRIKRKKDSAHCGALKKPQPRVSRVDLNQELNRVIFHGVLHLLGTNDKSAAQKAAMRKGEENWLKKFAQMLSG